MIGFSGVTVPWGNVTGFPGWSLPAANVSGVYNFSVGLGSLPWGNVTGFPGWTLPIANITNGTFSSANWIFGTNLTVTQNFTVNNDFAIDGLNSKINITANVTSGNNMTYVFNNGNVVCPIRTIGSQYNYTLCINSTGQKTETFGVFAA